jgi:hypothetical protein
MDRPPLEEEKEEEKKKKITAVKWPLYSLGHPQKDPHSAQPFKRSSVYLISSPSSPSP